MGSAALACALAALSSGLAVGGCGPLGKGVQALLVPVAKGGYVCTSKCTLVHLEIMVRRTLGLAHWLTWYKYKNKFTAQDLVEPCWS